MVDNLIIGSGITGMWLAKTLAETRPDEKTVIVSPSNTLGLMDTIWFGGGRFVADLGGHVYTAKDERVVSLMKDAGGILHEERKAFYIHREGDQYVDIPYPVQDHSEALGVTIEANSIEWTGQSLQQWATESFGPRFYDAWYRPFNKRVWTMDPSRMSSDWVANRVKVGGPAGGWGPNASFYYARGQDIYTVMQERLRGQADISLGLVSDVDPKTGEVTLAGGRTIKPKRLFWTASLELLLMFIGYPVKKLPDLQSNHIRAVCAATDFAEQRDWHWKYNTVGQRVHRITNLSAYHPGNCPARFNTLLFEMPYKEMSELPSWAKPDTQFRQNGSATTALMNNEKVQQWAWDVGIEVQDLDVTASIMLDFRGYPIPTLGLREQLYDVKRDLMKKSIFVAGRWGDWGYYNVEHCMDSAQAAVTAASKGASFADEEFYLKSAFYYKTE